MKYLLAGIAFAVALGISSARPQTAGERGDWCRWAAEQGASWLASSDDRNRPRAAPYLQVFSILGCDSAILIQELEKRKVRR